MAMVATPAVQQPFQRDAATASPPIIANPKTITWERLENLRLLRLGLQNKYSRHFNVTRSYKSMEEPCTSAFSKRPPPAPVERSKTVVVGKATSTKNNSLAPFSTVEKPTCGFFFNWQTVNKKQKFGIPPSDLVKWRNFEK